MTRTVNYSEESEFGDGPGLIDPQRRADRVVGQAATATGYQRAGEELWELYATNPANAEADPSTSKVGYAPEDTPWSDPSTAKGTS